MSQHHAGWSCCMIALAVSTLLLGVALGMRFKVLILVPALALALVTLAGVGLAGGNGVAARAVAAVLASCCLQLGYVAGAFARFSRSSGQSDKPSLQPHPRAVR